MHEKWILRRQQDAEEGGLINIVVECRENKDRGLRIEAVLSIIMSSAT